MAHFIIDGREEVLMLSKGTTLADVRKIRSLQPQDRFEVTNLNSGACTLVDLTSEGTWILHGSSKVEVKRNVGSPMERSSQSSVDLNGSKENGHSRAPSSSSSSQDMQPAARSLGSARSGGIRPSLLNNSHPGSSPHLDITSMQRAQSLPQIAPTAPVKGVSLKERSPDSLKDTLCRLFRGRAGLDNLDPMEAVFALPDDMEGRKLTDRFIEIRRSSSETFVYHRRVERRFAQYGYKLSSAPSMVPAFARSLVTLPPPSENSEAPSVCYLMSQMAVRVLGVRFDWRQMGITEEFKDKLEDFLADRTDDILRDIFEVFGTHVITSAILGGSVSLLEDVVPEDAIDLASKTRRLERTLRSATEQLLVDDIELRQRQLHWQQSLCWSGGDVGTHGSDQVAWRNSVISETDALEVVDVRSWVPMSEIIGAKLPRHLPSDRKDHVMEQVNRVWLECFEGHIGSLEEEFVPRARGSIRSEIVSYDDEEEHTPQYRRQGSGTHLAQNVSASPTQEAHSRSPRTMPAKTEAAGPEAVDAERWDLADLDDLDDDDESDEAPSSSVAVGAGVGANLGDSVQPASGKSSSGAPGTSAQDAHFSAATARKRAMDQVDGHAQLPDVPEGRVCSCAWDPACDELWIASHHSSFLVCYTFPARSMRLKVLLDFHPFGMAVSRQYVFVSNPWGGPYGGGLIEMYDRQSGEYVQTVELQGLPGPLGLVYDQSSQLLVFAAARSHDIWFMNPAGEIIRQIGADNLMTPRSVGIDAKGHVVVADVDGLSGVLLVLHPESGDVVRSFLEVGSDQTVTDVECMAVGVDGRIYAGEDTSGRVWRFSSLGEPEGEVIGPVDSEPAASLAVSKYGELVVGRNGRVDVYKI